MTIHQFAGNKAGGGAKNAADNLFSEDEVEVVLAISEGPIQGLRGGANYPTAFQNFFVGDTPLYGPDKLANFKNLDLTIYKGSPSGQVIKPAMGGFGTSIDVNTRLDTGLALTRQTLKHNVDYLELRMVINALYQETEKGTKENSVELKIEKRKLSESTYSPAFLVSTVSEHSDDDNKQKHRVSFDNDTARVVRNGKNFRHWWQNSAPPNNGHSLIVDDDDKPEVNRHYKQFGDSYFDHTPAVVHDAEYLTKGYSKHLFTWFDKNDNNRPYWLNRTGTTRKYVKVGERQQGRDNYVNVYEWQTSYTYAWQVITGAVFVNDGEKKYWKWTTNNFFADRVHQNKTIEYDRAAFFDIEDIDDEDSFRNGDLWLRDEGDDHIFMYNGSAWELPADNSGTIPSDDADSGIYPGGIVKISGKTTAPYVKELRMSVDRVDEPYQIRITKITDDSDSKKRCEVQWESIQEITRDPFNFKNLAIAHVRGRATDQFTSLPDFSGIYEGRIVKVPNNYDEKKRVYVGVWDGATWKLVFTNNPAFIVKDLVENTTYGLSAYYPVYLNNWDVYEAAAWCDVKVNDGKGGKRPRITFNGLIAEARPTREAIEYICGTFGGRFFDDGNGFARIKIDKDDPAVMLFTPEKVQDGLFVYSMTANEQRINDYTVEYVEPDLNWAVNRIRINDFTHALATQAKADIIARGRFPDDFTAVGCTNLSEALARGRYKVVTNLTEKTFVNFKTNRQGLYVDPYDIVLVADNESGFGLHGRVETKVDADTISLRDPIYLETGFTYVAKFQTINYTTGLFEIVERTITAGTTGTSRYDIHFTASLPSQVTADTTFTVEATSVGTPKAFRVLTLTEDDGEPDLISVTAIEVNRNKWTSVDGGIDEVNFAPVMPQVMTPVRGLRVHAKKTKVGEDPLWNMTVTWLRHSNKNIRKYDLWHKVNGGSWKQVGISGGLSMEIDNAHQGLHMFRIQGVDKDNHKTDPVFQSFSLIGTKRTVKKPVGLKLKNYVAGGTAIFEANDAIFTWSKNAIDKDKYWTRFQVEILDPISGVVQRTDTTTTNEYRYTYTNNKADFLGTPSRIVKIRVRQVDKFGNVSPGAVFTASNIAPSVPAGVYVQKGFSSIILTYSVPEKLDFLGIKVHVGATPGFTPDNTNLEYTGKNTRVEIPVASVVASPKYVKIAAYDRFSQTNLNYSSDYSIVVPKHPIYDTVAPGVPTGFSVTALANQAKAVWDNPNDNDLRAVELWYNTANDISTAKRVYRALGERATVVDFQTGVPYWFWARSVDNAENYSAFIGPIQITGRKGVIVTEVEDGAIEEVKTTNYVPNAPATATALNFITGDIDGDGTLDLGYTASWPVPVVDATHSAAKYYEIEIWRKDVNKGTDGNNVTGYTKWKTLTSVTESINFEVVSKYYHKARVRGMSFANKAGAFSAYTNVGVRHPGYNSMAGVTPAAPTVVSVANGFKISWAKPTDPTYLETEILVGGVNLTKVSATSYVDQTVRTLGANYSFTIKHYDKSGNSTNASAVTANDYRGIEGVDIADGTLSETKITALVPNAPATAASLTAITGDIDSDGTLDLGFTVAWPIPVVDSTHVSAKGYEVEIWRATSVGTAGSTTGYALWKKLTSQSESINFEAATKYFYKARARGIGFAAQKGTFSAFTNVGVRHPNYNAMAGVTPPAPTVVQVANGYKISWVKPTDPTYLETEILVGGVNLTKVTATSYVDQTVRTLGTSYSFTVKHYDKLGNATNASAATAAIYRGIEGVDIADGSIGDGKITVLVPNAPATPVALASITGDIDSDGTLDLGYTASWPIPVDDSTHVPAKYYELEIYRKTTDKGTDGSITGYAFWKKIVSQTESINFEVSSKYFHKARARAIGFANQKGAFSGFTNVGVRHPNYNAMAGVTPAAPTVVSVANGFKISWAKPTDPTYLETEILVGGVSLTRIRGTSFVDQTVRTLGANYSFTIKHYDNQLNATNVSTATANDYRGIEGVDIADGTLSETKITPLVPNAPAAPSLTAITGDIDNDGTRDLGYTVAWNIPAVDSTHISAAMYEVEIWRAAAVGTAGSITGYTLWKKLNSQTESINFEVVAKWYHKARVRAIGFAGQKSAFSGYTSVGLRHPGYNAMAGVTPAAPTVAAIGAGFKISWAALADPTYYETAILVAGVEIARNSGTTFIDNTIRTKGTSYSYTIRHYDRAGNSTNVSATTAIVYRGINNGDIEDDAVTAAKTDGTAPATPGALTLTQIAKDIDLDGKIDIGVKVTWAASTGAVRYEIEMSECATTNGTYVVSDNGITSALLMTFKTSTTKFYRFRIRSFSFNGTPSAWGTLYPTATTGFKPAKKTTLPTVPGSGLIDGPGYTASYGSGMATIYWDRSPDPDYAYTEVWLNPNSTTLAAAFLASRVNGTSYIFQVGRELPVYVWLRNVDTSGNKSAYFDMNEFGALIDADADKVPGRTLAKVSTPSAKMAFMDHENMIPDGYFSEGAGDVGFGYLENFLDYWVPTGGTFDASNPGNTASNLRAYATLILSGGNALLFDRKTVDSTTNIDIMSREFWPCAPNVPLAWEIAFSGIGGTSAAGAYYRIYWYDADYAPVSGSYTTVMNNVAIASTYTINKGIVTPPSDARYFKVRIYHATTSTIRYMAVDRISLRKAEAQKLIPAKSLLGSQIGTNEINARVLAPRDFGNMIPGAGLDDMTEGWNAFDPGIGGTISFLDSTTSFNGRNISFTSGALTAAAGSSYLYSITSDRFPVEPGQKYAMGMMFDPNTGFTGGLHMYLQFFDGADVAVTGDVIIGVTDNAGSATAQVYDTVATAPAGAAKARVYFRRRTAVNAGSATGTGYVRNAYVRKAIETKLVADNAFSITAQAASAGSVSLTTSEVVVGTIALTMGLDIMNVILSASYVSTATTAQTIRLKGATSGTLYTVIVTQAGLVGVDFSVDKATLAALASETFTITVQLASGTGAATYRRITATALKR